MNKQILNSIVFILVIGIGATVAIAVKERHDAAVQQQGYTNALKAMKQTGHDQHDTDYMNPKKSP